MQVSPRRHAGPRRSARDRFRRRGIASPELAPSVCRRRRHRRNECDRSCPGAAKLRPVSASPRWPLRSSCDHGELSGRGAQRSSNSHPDVLLGGRADPARRRRSITVSAGKVSPDGVARPTVETRSGARRSVDCGYRGRCGSRRDGAWRCRLGGDSDRRWRDSGRSCRGRRVRPQPSVASGPMPAPWFCEHRLATMTQRLASGHRHAWSWCEAAARPR
jgi:hypothetical protein